MSAAFEPVHYNDIRRGDIVSWDTWPGNTVTDVITAVERGASGVPYRVYRQNAWCIEATAHWPWGETVALLKLSFTRPTTTN
jgi:hypothetical protein